MRPGQRFSFLREGDEVWLKEDIDHCHVIGRPESRMRLTEEMQTILVATLPSPGFVVRWGNEWLVADRARVAVSWTYNFGLACVFPYEWGLDFAIQGATEGRAIEVLDYDDARIEVEAIREHRVMTALLGKSRRRR